MTRVRDQKSGELLRVKGRPIKFSRHLVKRGDRRFGLQTRIFATNPWSVIKGSINEIDDPTAKKQAKSFVDQAEDFYRAYQSAHEVSSKPLLVYYSLMNLVKAFCLYKDVVFEYGKAQHGLQEGVHPGGVEFRNSFLKAFTSRSSRVNIFGDFYQAFTGSPMVNRERVFDLEYIHPQILQGHRLWAAANGVQERFVEIERIDFLHDAVDKRLWIVLNIFSDDLTRFGISRKKLIDEGGLYGVFHNVNSEEYVGDRLLLKFEQSESVSYTGRPSDKLGDLVSILKDQIWSAVLRAPPYRKNYLYLSPSTERKDRIPQILSIYAFIYYLGSVTRYRPYFFDTLLSQEQGAHIEELISNIPQQFLFLLASEFSKREVAHAPIV